MYDTKLISLISTLNVERRRKLRKWIKSNFVNKNDDIIKFFEYIDSRKSLSPRSITKDKAHDFVYPQTQYNDLRIRHLLWMTTEIVEDFVAYSNIHQQPILYKQLLAQNYIEHEYYKLAEQIIEENIADLEHAKQRNVSYHLQHFQAQALYFRLKSRNDRSSAFNLQKVMDQLAIFSIIESLKYACISQSIQKISANMLNNHLLDATFKLLENPFFLNNTAVRIYYNTYKVLTNEDEDAYKELIIDLKESSNSFSLQDVRELYLSAINFCIKKSNQNIAEYTLQAFDLYIYAIQHKYLMEHNEISRFSFTNVVTLGLKLKELDRTEKFILQFSKSIHIEYRKMTVGFNMAKVQYAKGDLQKALKHLLTNEFNDILWNLNAKYLILKILFELNDMKMFAIHLKAFKMFVQRKANIGYHRDYFVNVGKALIILRDIQKQPEQFKDFSFSKDTADIEWFNKELAKIKKSARKPTKRKSSKKIKKN